MCKTCSDQAAKLLTNDMHDEIVEASELFSEDIVAQHYGDEYQNFRSNYAMFIFRVFRGRLKGREQELQEGLQEQWKDLRERAEHVLKTGEARGPSPTKAGPEDMQKVIPEDVQKTVSELAEKLKKTEFNFTFDPAPAKGALGDWFMEPDKIKFTVHHDQGGEVASDDHPMDDEQDQSEGDPGFYQHLHEFDDLCACGCSYGSHTAGTTGPCITDDCSCAHFVLAAPENDEPAGEFDHLPCACSHKYAYHHNNSSVCLVEDCECSAFAAPIAASESDDHQLNDAF